MTTIIAIFLLSLGLCLNLTPIVIRVAEKYNLVDPPSERDVHTRPIPRFGGIAIYISFFLPFSLALFYNTKVLDLLVPDRRVIFLVLGASLMFGLGLWDDFKRLKPRIKFSIQFISALLAYYGGIQINVLSSPWSSGSMALGWLSLPATVLWFILVINAINLIDGLDGLAAGVTLFASLVLLVLCISSENFLVAMGFASLGGAALGFLRYNFNPASIFMGDSGSYFLGYMLAALSIFGSVKGQATVAILIPILALGVPLMDTLLAPIRRFVLGKRMFKPDTGHFHHRLLKLGLSQRRAVILLYVITVCMGAVVLFMVNVRDERAALILILLGVALVFGVTKLGYLEYFAMDKVVGWLKDVSDDVGISHGRRSFLNLQMEINSSADIAQLWQNVSSALDRLEFDMAEMNIKEIRPKAQGSGLKEGQTEKKEEKDESSEDRKGFGDSGTRGLKGEESLVWMREQF
ncbi:MAG: undecaprenyl/decaprenyl-phosphate alpha-N-acetylglucosaminyl 1-phosphate transferase, partial [Deltaproteobacteria bacterium]|nr:undecaprenyl/decaprenyl-phosphate alpha-N-acetylglucosaminyl 1-phosphate transferase [Deltaproteobacteria bacterium]